MLVLGVLTPILSGLCCGTQIVVIMSGTLALMPGGWLAAWVPAANALALMLLGPGAYSFDARAFGRQLLLVRSSREL
jgi:uncharacterized membrane protein YphA (DoxX/SURF4 family)